MSFPVAIAGVTYASAEDLAQDLRYRAVHLVRDNYAQDDPADHFRTSIARTPTARQALAEAALLGIPRARSVDELRLLISIPANPLPELCEAWLDRWERGPRPTVQEAEIEDPLAEFLIRGIEPGSELEPDLERFLRAIDDRELDFLHAYHHRHAGPLIDVLGDMVVGGTAAPDHVALAVDAVGLRSDSLFALARVLAQTPRRPLRDKLRNTVRRSYPDWYAEHGVELRRLLNV